MVPLATGSDGGGSIRIPSAVCGLSGFKPTLGRIPNAGPIAAGWGMLSTSGPMARRIRDIVYVLDAVVGPHPLDPWSWPVADGPWAPALDPALPVRVAWSSDLGYGPVDESVRSVCADAVAALAKAGCEVVEVAGPFAADPLPPWLVLASTFLLRSLLPYRGTEAWERITPGLREEIEWAHQHLDATDFVLAVDAAHEAHVALAEGLASAGVEVLLSPTVAGFAPPVGGTGTINGEEDPNWVRFTYPFNLTRSPAGTVCAGFVDGLPVGLQAVGMPGHDLAVLRALAGLEDLLAIDEVAPVS
jgi:aspartyl-tRNA(Asn)/glutamyl-tRNA(Gln) amidotransferase subunit A